MDFLSLFSAPGRGHGRDQSESLRDQIDKLRLMVLQRAEAKNGNMRNPFSHFTGGSARRKYFEERDLEEGLVKLDFDVNSKGVRSIFEMMDRNGDGRVNFNEFATFVYGRRYHEVEARLRRQLTENAHRFSDSRDLKRIFNRYDRDREGYLRGDDFQDALRELHFDIKSHEVDILMARYDRNGDGRFVWRVP